MYELEIKLKLEDASRIGELLVSALDAKPTHINYYDQYFDTPDGRLTREERELRLRRKSQAGIQEWWLTSKSPPFEVSSKSKMELEVRVDPGNLIPDLLKIIDYHSVLEFEKLCTLYSGRFDGHEVVATVVQVPDLPVAYLELETQLATRGETENALMSLRKLRDVLGLTGKDETTEYYTDLVRRKRNSRD